MTELEILPAIEKCDALAFKKHFGNLSIIGWISTIFFLCNLV